jgi:hypothetical protein
VGAKPVRCSIEMSCTHQGLHEITSSYDRELRVLTHYAVCDLCGRRLGDVSRLPYEPRFEPSGVDPSRPVVARPDAVPAPVER